MIYKLNINNLTKISTIGRIKYKQGWSNSRTLRNDNLFFVLSGEFQFVTPNGTVTVSEGNLQFLPSGTHYTVHAVRECDYFYLHFLSDRSKCTVSTDEYRRFVSGCANDSRLGIVKEQNYVYLEDRYDLSEQKEALGKMIHMFTKCESLMLGDELYSAINAGSTAIEIIAALGEMTYHKYIPEDHRPVALVKMLEYVKTHYTKPISLSELAEGCGVSKQYAMRLFKKHYNMTVTQYINRFKLEKAMKMLRYTTLNIDEISFSLGYSATYYFCRLFKRNFGCTPTEYRNKEIVV